ncbi:MAG: hypothetical protein AAGJ31_04675, partial [Verrucomicrobiota bacterium]
RSQTDSLNHLRWLLGFALIAFIVVGSTSWSAYSEAQAESRYIGRMGEDAAALERLLLSQPWTFRSPQNINRLDFRKDGTILVSGDVSGTWHWEIPSGESIVITQNPYGKHQYYLEDRTNLTFRGKPDNFKHFRYLTPYDEAP